jgi:mxaJ protein
MRAALLALALAAPAYTIDAPRQRTLTICADPNNLPFSNQAREGFENRIAELIARDMGAQVKYVWWAQRRGYARNTINAGACDLWPGVAKGVDALATTAPYYRSTYVFVTRADRPLAGLTFDDARLRSLKIGVQMVGDDAQNTPPAHALAQRGITDNVHGFMLYGNYKTPNPPARIIDAVEKGDIDVAIAWGPLAGYFAKRSPLKLRVEPVTPTVDDGQWPMTYAIAIGVRKAQPALKAEIERILTREASAIGKILADYGVPIAPAAP